MKLCIALLLLFALATAWGQGADYGGAEQPQAADYAPPPQTARQQDDCPCNAVMTYDPVCGTDGVTYANMQRLRCAQRCRSNVQMRFRGAC